MNEINPDQETQEEPIDSEEGEEFWVFPGPNGPFCKFEDVKMREGFVLRWVPKQRNTN